ncbi:MAG: HlyC/CorC family transporter [Anaerolineales bacterium]|nr:HlyC/CorC family transporter [Anaerolineales bacterium]
MNNSQILIFIALIFLDLVFTAIRTGFLHARYPRLISMKESGDADVDKALEMVTNRARTRSTLKFSQTLLRFGLAGMVLRNVVLEQAVSDNRLYFFGMLLLIGVLIWLIEFVVERIVLQDPEGWTLRLTPLANVIIAVLYPFVFVPLRLATNSQGQKLANITEEELIHLVEASHEAGEIEKDESEMIHSVFEFGDTLAKEIMVPRVDMLALEVDTPLEEAADQLLESGFSRVPVYENQIDNIIGLLYTKDMLQVWRSGDKITSLRPLLRPAQFIPETKKVDELLDEIQAARVHIAIVVDEYGGVAGLVTLEDIIEEIFGEIEDEYDEEVDELWRQVGPYEYIFDGRTLLEDINELLDTDLPTNEADTIGGLVFARAGQVPREGDSIVENGITLTVEELHERRVHLVRALFPLESTETDSEREIQDGE